MRDDLRKRINDITHGNRDAQSRADEAFLNHIGGVKAALAKLFAAAEALDHGTTLSGHTFTFRGPDSKTKYDHRTEAFKGTAFEANLTSDDDFSVFGLQIVTDGSLTTVELTGTACRQHNPVLPFGEQDSVEICDRFVSWLAANRLCAPASIETTRAIGRLIFPGHIARAPADELKWYDS
jgi:hypothetical protein